MKASTRGFPLYSLSETCSPSSVTPVKSGAVSGGPEVVPAEPDVEHPAKMAVDNTSKAAKTAAVR